MKNIEDVAAISNAIHAIEDDFDGLLGQVGILMSQMTAFRVDTDMDAIEGQKAIARVANMQAKLSDARMDAVVAHGELKKLQETNDLPSVCPPDNAEIEGENVVQLAG